MIRKSFFFIAIFFISMTMGAGQVMAQKQERVEKLLKFLSENESEKFQKSREKLDEETVQAFASEIGLIDLMNRLWNQPDSKCATDYYPAFEKAGKGAFPAICTAAKLDIADLQKRSDAAISAILEADADKLTLSKQLADLVKSTGYPATQAQMDHFYQTREDALMAESEKAASIAKCENYFKEFPDGQYLPQFMNQYNQLLYNAVKRSPTDTNFKRFFDNMELNKFFNGMSNRKYTQEVRALYDDYLFSMSGQAGALASKKQCIDNYEHSSYLGEGERKHTTELEYTKDSVDFELMKPEINSATKLELVCGYLTTHKYKEFRDKAHALRNQYEDTLIWITPTSVKTYVKGLLMKSEEKQNNKTRISTYAYLDNGKPASVNVTDNGLQLQTSFLYDAQDRCAQEIQVNVKSKKEVYKRTRNFDANGTVLSDSLKYADGRLVLSSYNRQGELIEEKTFNKDVMLSSTAHQYDSKGRIVKSQYVLPLPAKPLPTQISSRTDIYEYDKYGYLHKITSTQILVNNEKRTCVQYFMYDEYGNPVDSNTYYEYNPNGRWIRKVVKDHPEWTEEWVIN